MTALPTPDSFSLELSSIWTSKRNFKRNSLICKCGKDLSLGRGASQSVITDKILASTKAKTRSTLPRIKSLWIRGLLLSMRTCTNYVRINTVSGKLANFWTQQQKFSTATINDRQLSHQKIRQKIAVIITNTNSSLHFCFQDKTWIKMPKWTIF